MILLVEDEPGILEALCAYLRIRGFEVVGASSLSDARRALSTRTPSALITDVDLGDGDGLLLVDEVRLLSPGLSCLVLSARKIESIENRLGDCSGVEILQKPVRPVHIVQWLESIASESDTDPVEASGLVGLSDAEKSLTNEVLRCLYGESQLPTISRAWSEGDRIRLRVSAPSRAISLNDLAASERNLLLKLDLDLWPGGALCTEVSFLSHGAVGEKEHVLAAFVSTSGGQLIEKVHEDAAWANLASSSTQGLGPCSSGTEVEPSLSEGQLGRVDEERRLLWPDASHPGVDARCEAVVEQ